MFKNLTWKCDVCGRTRPDEKIEVFKKDVSTQYNLAPGIMVVNIKYCADNEDCKSRAPGKVPSPF